jgi:hypothetical protein
MFGEKFWLVYIITISRNYLSEELIDIVSLNRMVVLLSSYSMHWTEDINIQIRHLLEVDITCVGLVEKELNHLAISLAYDL